MAKINKELPAAEVACHKCVYGKANMNYKNREAVLQSVESVLGGTEK